ncbi:MAG TPA: hypothetical protein VIL85_11870 [Thermomicrobiales bacterium]|jgi:hypothetical protein
MNNVLTVVGLLGFILLIATAAYETWLGVGLRQPSMTRIVFGAGVSLKILLIATMSYILYAIRFPASLGVEHFGIERREYIRVILYFGLLAQTIGVAIALYRWDRRAVRVHDEDAEARLIMRQRELHERMEKGRIARESPTAARDRRAEERADRAEEREIARDERANDVTQHIAEAPKDNDDRTDERERNLH